VLRNSTTESHRVPRRFIAGHAAICAGFVLFAVWLTYPLVWNSGTHLPGAGAGDNVAFLWNSWWLGEWAAGRGNLFFTDRLFAPAGTPLVLHTHTTLPSALAFLLPFGSVIAQHNAVLIAALAANGIAAYALAFRHVRQVVPSAAAGLLFSGSAYVCAHLPGHFNLVQAWVLPVSALAWLRFVECPSLVSGTILGAAIAAAAYTDYYYLVYVVLLIATWAGHRCVTFNASWQRRPWDRTLSILLLLDLVLLIFAGSVAAFGDLSFDLLGQHISIRNVRNPLSLLYALLLWTVIYAFKLRILAAFQRIDVQRGWFRSLAAALVVVFVLTLPIALAAIRLVAAGDYVSQPMHWSSSPPGVDLLTLVSGHPTHVITGHASQSLLRRLGIDVVEQIGWVSVAALLIVGWSRAARAASPLWSFWTAVAVVFAILAAGPFLRVAGSDTGLPLPWAGARYVFPFSNARIPGRALVMTVLAVAILLAYSLARVRKGRLLLAGIIAIELFPAPVPLYELPLPDAVDAYLRGAPISGAVAELPAGIRDGFGETGRLDHRALVHQLHHGRPLVGGFVARLSPRIAALYAEDPGLRAWLELSAGRPADLPTASTGSAGRVPFVVVNGDMFTDLAAIRQLLLGAGYTLIETAGARELYKLSALD
jgi:hypothetical protein